MNQTSWIAAFLFIGFIVYVTVKGQLPQYRAAIFGTSGSSSTSTTTGAASGTASVGTTGGGLLGALGVGQHSAGF
jgi:hypothetical protein